MSNFVGPELTDALSALVSLTCVALAAARVAAGARSSPRARGSRSPTPAQPDTSGRIVRAYASYGILIVTVLIGQIGNFAGMSNLKPPANMTALLKCGQGGNKLCPEPWFGPTAAADPQGFRFPVWEFNWPGAYAMRDGKVSPLVAREAPVVAVSSPYPLTYRLDFLAAAGTLVIIASLIAFVPMLIFGVPFSALGVTFVKTVQAAAAAGDHDRVHPVDRDGDELLRA